MIYIFNINNLFVIVSLMSQPRVYICGLCDKTFSKMSQIKHHSRFAHTIIDHKIKTIGQMSEFLNDSSLVKVGHQIIYNVPIPTSI